MIDFQNPEIIRLHETKDDFSKIIKRRLIRKEFYKKSLNFTLILPKQSDSRVFASVCHTSIFVPVVKMLMLGLVVRSCWAWGQVQWPV